MVLRLGIFVLHISLDLFSGSFHLFFILLSLLYHRLVLLDEVILKDLLSFFASFEFIFQLIYLLLRLSIFFLDLI